MAGRPDRTVLVTGGSAGLGYHCARELLQRGWSVVVTSPDAGRAASAAQRLADATGKDAVTGQRLELASQAAVRAFAAGWEDARLPPLRGIVCNAGIQGAPAGERSEDGLEKTFAVNHLGHFLLVNLMLVQLIAPARIVFVSSSTHDPARRTGVSPPPWTGARDLADPSAVRSSGQAYAATKLCNVLCAYEFDRRLRAAGLSTPEHPVTSNAFDPGLMPGTELARDQGAAFRFLWHRVLPILGLALPFIKSPARSGAHLASLISDCEYANSSSIYFAGPKPERSSEISYSQQVAEDLWETSAALVNLQSQESPLVGPAPADGFVRAG